MRVPQTLKDLMSPRCSWDWSRAHRTFLYSTCAYLRCICISPISPTIIIVIFWLFVSICYVSQLLFVIGIVTSVLWVLLLLLFVVICYTYYWCRNRGCTKKLKRWETGDERMFQVVAVERQNGGRSWVNVETVCFKPQKSLETYYTYLHIIKHHLDLPGVVALLSYLVLASFHRLCSLLFMPIPSWQGKSWPEKPEK